MTPIDKTAKVFVAGHRGLAGSALVRALERHGYGNVVVRSRNDVDLLDRGTTRAFFETERPAYVYLAAAKVGGIKANDTYPVEFLAENLTIQQNVIQAAHDYGVTKLMFLASSCIYPRLAPQPMREDALLTGPLEPTNEAYAIAKIAGIKMCQAYARQYGDRFVSVIPCNLYGPGDNYDLTRSHVLPALIRRFHEAKRDGLASVALWGTGKARREFLHSDDLAEACVLLMEQYESADTINIGSGDDIAIADLGKLAANAVGYTGAIGFNSAVADGMPQKLLDITKLTSMGWKPAISLTQGIDSVYEEYKSRPEATISR
ncbi:MAG TPA: GDP-L-fucose synthase [Capsulimonadaceae bacterium]|jgi:GDP-L-fucose synthase